MQNCTFFRQKCRIFIVFVNNSTNFTSKKYIYNREIEYFWLKQKPHHGNCSYGVVFIIGSICFSEEEGEGTAVVV